MSFLLLEARGCSWRDSSMLTLALACLAAANLTYPGGIPASWLVQQEQLFLWLAVLIITLLEADAETILEQKTGNSKEVLIQTPVWIRWGVLLLPGSTDVLRKRVSFQTESAWASCCRSFPTSNPDLNTNWAQFRFCSGPSHLWSRSPCPPLSGRRPGRLRWAGGSSCTEHTNIQKYHSSELPARFLTASQRSADWSPIITWFIREPSETLSAKRTKPIWASDISLIWYYQSQITRYHRKRTSRTAALNRVHPASWAAGSR